ncbi:MAG: sugar ABC transporter permease [Bacillati bacterium ANGP1]|uniref:Sugar ABC transporter permease n=1 Tax=Candidatus Segetimicrobium genomatis TaxID=2569760 RepID=A0A537JEK9_9BACT|nr:MAG: sugar ABC transporter permease [Terrabacteria group bacterium ANGP1]
MGLRTTPADMPAKARDVGRARPWLRSAEARHQAWGYLFLAPMFLLLVVFKFVPMLQAFYLSLTSYDLLSPPRFVGLRNYATLLQDPLFHQSVGVTAYYVFGTCVLIWFVSLGMALIFNAPLPAKNVLRTIYFIPAIVPVVVYAIIWLFLFHPYGLLNVALHAIGLPAVQWLSDTRAVLPGFILSSLWRFAPYFMIIYLAGLQSIPLEYYEAAAIDGAAGAQAFRCVTLPLLRPTILLVVVVSIILMSKVFTNVLIITGGGPAGATRVLSLFIYQTGFQYFKMGLASAASIFLLFGTMTFTLLQLRLFRDDPRG